MTCVLVRVFRRYPRSPLEHQRRPLGIRRKIELEIRCKLAGGGPLKMAFELTRCPATLIDISGSTIDDISIPPIAHIHEVLNKALGVLRHHGILHEKPQLAISEIPSGSEWEGTGW